ncbi:Lsr2 family protein [Streptomyces virginiae]|uniref:histone-like nucleoid-structuring protein Lsr2 n=1 Tax=Streptomyces virginiae TaxID=1961 RepID=UPI00367DB5D9
MAQKTVTIYLDDLTNEESPEVNTHTFALDGVTYEIDLTPDNYDKLYESLHAFISVSRKAGRVKTSRRRGPAVGVSAEDVRAWARSQGLEVNSRGRVPALVREAYQAAH